MVACVFSIGFLPLRGSRAITYSYEGWPLSHMSGQWLRFPSRRQCDHGGLGCWGRLIKDSISLFFATLPSYRITLDCSQPVLLAHTVPPIFFGP